MPIFRIFTIFALLYDRKISTIHQIYPVSQPNSSLHTPSAMSPIMKRSMTSPPRKMDSSNTVVGLWTFAPYTLSTHLSSASSSIFCKTNGLETLS